MKKILYECTVCAIGILSLFLLLLNSAHAQVASSSPYVTTSTTPNGVNVEMNLPHNFKGQVYTVYNDGTWQTFSTTTPLTSTDIASMQNEIQEEETDMQNIFAEQEKLFNEE